METRCSKCGAREFADDLHYVTEVARSSFGPFSLVDHVFCDACYERYQKAQAWIPAMRADDV